MSRKSRGLAPLKNVPVILGHKNAGKWGQTLIGQAARALMMAGRFEEAQRMRNLLVTTRESRWIAIMEEYVRFWPEDALRHYRLGDPRRGWPDEQHYTDQALHAARSAAVAALQEEGALSLAASVAPEQEGQGASAEARAEAAEADAETPGGGRDDAP